MKTKILFGLSLAFIVIIINSCENKHVVAPQIVLSGNCDTINPTYSSGNNTVQDIIGGYCASIGCHVPGGTAPTQYLSYSEIQPYATGGTDSQFYQYIFVNKTMPLYPALPLDPCSAAKLRIWLLAGAPQ